MISFNAAEEIPAAEVLDILLTLGDLPLGRDKITLFTPTLFHGGIPMFDSHLLGPYVVFIPGEDPPEEILYGFGLPLDDGKWDVEAEWFLQSETPQTDNSQGAFRVLSEGRELAKSELVCGDTNAYGGIILSKLMTFETANRAPVTIRFKYGGKERVAILAVKLTKAE